MHVLIEEEKKLELDSKDVLKFLIKLRVKLRKAKMHIEGIKFWRSAWKHRPKNGQRERLSAVSELDKIVREVFDDYQNIMSDYLEEGTLAYQLMPMVYNRAHTALAVIEFAKYSELKDPLQYSRKFITRSLGLLETVIDQVCSRDDPEWTKEVKIRYKWK